MIRNEHVMVVEVIPTMLLDVIPSTLIPARPSHEINLQALIEILLVNASKSGGVVNRQIRQDLKISIRTRRNDYKHAQKHLLKRLQMIPKANSKLFRSWRFKPRETNLLAFYSFWR